MSKELDKYKIEFDSRWPEKWTRDQWNKVVAELEITPQTMLTIHEAANFVGHKLNRPDGDIVILCQQMMDAVGYDLTVRRPSGDDYIPIGSGPRGHEYVPTAKERLEFVHVRADDLDKWFEAKGKPYRIQLDTDTKPGIPTGKGEAVRGITKRRVMAAFQDLRWDYDHWGKNLASPPKWLIECRVAKGSRSKKASALWNPAQIAVALLKNKSR